VDIARILIDLKAQRDKLNQAIAALEAISPQAHKRSRPTNRRSRRPPKSRRRPRASTHRTQPTGKLIPFRRTRRRTASKPFQAEA
jgi:hypothetical protein